MRFLIFLFFTFSAFANENFWKLYENGQFSNNSKSVQVVEGKLTFFKKYIRARDNYFLLNIQDPDGNSYVEIKFYTIKKLKRINVFECHEGDKISIKGSISFKKKDAKIGSMIIDRPADLFSCNKTIK